MPELPQQLTGPRFLTLLQFAEELNISESQGRALIRAGDVAAIQIGGRGQWRIERIKIEEYIQGRYAAAEADRQNIGEETDETQ